MKKLKAAIAGFPGRELAIRRLYFRDADFRAVCEDYFDAMEARRRWQGVDSRAAEYCEIIIELEHEIRTFLDRRTDPLHECNECGQKNDIENE